MQVCGVERGGEPLIHSRAFPEFRNNRDFCTLIAQYTKLSSATLPLVINMQRGKPEISKRTLNEHGIYYYETPCPSDIATGQGTHLPTHVNALRKALLNFSQMIPPGEEFKGVFRRDDDDTSVPPDMAKLFLCTVLEAASSFCHRGLGCGGETNTRVCGIIGGVIVL